MAHKIEYLEGSKENILPIRQGRKADAMISALQNTEEIQQKRTDFEDELRTYDGDDPLSVWFNYINWVEQTYVKGGRECNLQKLTKTCLFSLKGIEKYRNDPRMLKIWLKFANTSSDPLDVFGYMYNENFCCKFAQFYVQWAYALENVGNLKAANDKLKDGVKAGAEPLEQLEIAISQLDRRSMKKFIQEQADLPSEPEAEQRTAFNKLKPQGKKHTAPFVRVGDFIDDKSDAPLTIGHAQPQPRKLALCNRQPFAIYNGIKDECVVPLPPVSSEKSSSHIFQSDVHKENSKNPEKWQKVKTKKWMTPAPKAAVKELAFTVHVDDTQQPAVSPKKLTDGFTVLSVRKNAASSPPLALFEPLNPKARPMYDKIKVYCGAQEYSFEEIRAAVWFHKQRAKAIVEYEEYKLRSEQLKMEQKMAELHVEPNVDGINAIVQNGSACGSNLKDNKVCVSQGEREGEVSSLGPSNEQELVDDINKSLVPSSSSNSSPKFSSTADDSHFESVCQKDAVLEELLASGNFGQGSLHCEHPHPSQSAALRPPYGMTTDILSMMESLCDEPVVKERNTPDVSGYAGNSEYLEKLCNSICDQQVLPPHGMDKPFEIYCDAEDEKSFLPSKPKLDLNLQNVSDTAYIQRRDIENIPPPEYYENMYIENEKPPNTHTSDKLEPSAFICSPEEEKNTKSEEPSPLCNFIDNDYTLVPPLNTAHFVINAFSASTPNPSKRRSSPSTSGEKSCHSPSPLESSWPREQTEVCKRSPEANILCGLQSGLHSDGGEAKMFSELIPQTEEVKETVLTSSSNNVSAAVPEFISAQLSTIIETSNEYQSSKSSSSSSNSAYSGRAGISSHSHHHWLPHTSLSRTTKPNSTLGSLLTSVPGSPPQQTGFPEECSNATLDTRCSTNINTIKISPIDPFGPKASTLFLRMVEKDLSEERNYQANYLGSVRSIKSGEDVYIGNDCYHVSHYLTCGSYAKVYSAYLQTSSPSPAASGQSQRRVALKVSREANEWEFYICTELQLRLKNSPGIDVTDSVMKCLGATLFSDGVVLNVSDLCENGTLVDTINAYRSDGTLLPETLVMYLTFELLHILSRMHQIGFLHGDVKADNILLVQIPSAESVIAEMWEKTQCLRLIDFGRGVDLKLLDPNTAFTTSVKVFERCEELQKLPFIYQADWFGAAGVIHVLLFTQYMKLERDKDGFLMPTQKLKRYWHSETLWKPLFRTLLNLPLCTEPLDVSPFLHCIAEDLKIHELRSAFSNLQSRLKK